MDRRESFFFKLSEWGKNYLNILKNPDFILPLSRRNEVISFVKLFEDLSFQESFKWGIKVEGTKNHIMYVWTDA